LYFDNFGAPGDFSFELFLKWLDQFRRSYEEASLIIPAEEDWEL